MGDTLKLKPLGERLHAPTTPTRKVTAGLYSSIPQLWLFNVRKGIDERLGAGNCTEDPVFNLDRLDSPGVQTVIDCAATIR